MKKILVLFFMFALSACGVEQVDTGNRGVKVVYGKVVEESLPEDLYFYNPISSSIYEIDCKVRKGRIEMKAYTKDMQQADLNVAINYNVVPEDAWKLYKYVGIGYESKIIEPNIVNAVKNVIGKWEADNLIENRDLAAKDILISLSETLEKSFISVHNVMFEDINYSDNFENAIEEKVVAIQRAEEAKNKTLQIEEEAKQKVISAKAEAESMRIRSQALSQNQNLVSYEAVQKWDGKLPVNIYGNAPIPFLNLK